jgi:hypothetical protein
VIVAGLLALAPAAADAPTMVEESFDRSIPHFATCPGFTVAGEFDVNRTVFTFVDANSTPIERVTHVQFTGTLTNTATGKSIPDEGNQIVLFAAGQHDLQNGLPDAGGFCAYMAAP